MTLRFEDGGNVRGSEKRCAGGADQPFDEKTLLSKLVDNAAPSFPPVPETLKKVIGTDARLLARPWREVLTEMTKA